MVSFGVDPVSREWSVLDEGPRHLLSYLCLPSFPPVHVVSASPNISFHLPSFSPVLTWGSLSAVGLLSFGVADCANSTAAA